VRNLSRTHHRLGRPRVDIDGREVVRLRAAGASWRDIAAMLGVGTATAMRAYRAHHCVPKASQNSHLTTAEAKSPNHRKAEPSDDFETGVPWAVWKAEMLNRIFLEQGCLGQPGRITPETVVHGERKRRAPLKKRPVTDDNGA
jgi:hypothetical protein